jgi:lipopolysaccharide transport system ATP-binding protein
MPTAISVEHLSKAYRLGQIGTGTLTYDMKLWWAKVRGKPNPLLKIGEQDHGNRDGEIIWALKDVSFQVEQGEVLGIIGHNGAGKSTLLKILSRVTAPTSGKITGKGRVASLLEVGTGFHPELTGRENIYLNGAILGMSRREIERKFDEIVDFAEVEKFIDTPVKRYSSGMYVRLAFAVAAYLEPDILLVDEVLAVGDAAFQKKCLGKMSEVAYQGRTVLFVSHNLVAIESLSDRAICLLEGKCLQEGKPNQVVSAYLRNSIPTTVERFFPQAATIQVGEEVRLHCVRIRPMQPNDSEAITVNTPLSLEFEYWNYDPTASISISYSLYNEHDVLLFDICPPIDPDQPLTPSLQGLLRTVCHIPGDFLNDGLHRVDLVIVNRDVRIIHEPFALTFNVQDSHAERGGWYGEWPGAIRPKLKWENILLRPIEMHNHAL